MGRIVIGTSGYSYADWIGPYYPEGTSSSAFLTQYSRDFALTELNFSYYRMPDPRMLSRLVAKTPDDFRFVVKAHRSITHDRAASWREDARRFAGATRELQKHGRLAGLLLQFPYSFHYTTSNRRYLAELCEALQVASRADAVGAQPSASQPCLFVEYRNTEWQRQSVYEEMRARNLALVITDMPRLRGLPAPASVVTADRAYLRFHGRNASQWWEGDNRSRYDYLYSAAELEEWVIPIRAVADQVSELIVTFNNHANAQAVVNAKTLIALLGGPSA
ncbi:MAG: DUF72 domain-containing protein [Spirochaetes bacterium]|jgi:uncharacterized protein YecE (DUF72 family)|nr:DUF72 domain-containing protein [Spirochaetota bacterium]